MKCGHEMEDNDNIDPQNLNHCNPCFMNLLRILVNENKDM